MFSDHTDLGYNYEDVEWDGLDEEFFVRSVATVATDKLLFPQDTHEIFSRAAEPKTFPLGSSVNGANATGVEISGNVNLESFSTDLTQIFEREEEDHSAEFRSTILRRHAYWRQLLDDFKLIKENDEN